MRFFKHSLSTTPVPTSAAAAEPLEETIEGLDRHPGGDRRMKSHPVAEIFPLMASADFEALVDDIRRHGQRERIVVHDGLILDGRNRYQACLQLGIEPLTAEWDGTGTPEAFVISMNIRRRHLGSGQRAMIAKRLATLSNGQKKPAAQICAASQAEAAELLKVSRRSVQHAAVVQEKAAPELVEAVDRGDISVSRAAQLVNLPKARQREIATAPGKLAARLATKSARRVRTAKARRAHGTWQPDPTPKETEHDRDLRILRDTWVATCESAKAAFLKEQATNGVGTLPSEADHAV